MLAARSVKGPDQSILTRYVWGWAKQVSMQHDSYTCGLYSGSIGFPSPRRNQTNNFVASVVNQNMYLWRKCPRQCRRRGHEDDWEYC